MLLPVPVLPVVMMAMISSWHAAGRGIDDGGGGLDLWGPERLSLFVVLDTRMCSAVYGGNVRYVVELQGMQWVWGDRQTECSDASAHR